MYSSDLVGTGIVAIFMVIAFTIALILWIIGGIGLKKMADREGIENSWLAFIPIGDQYIVGKLIGEMDVFGINIENPEIVLPISYFLAVILEMIPIIGFFAGIAFIILMVISRYQLFKKYTESAVLYTILSFVLSFMYYIFLFILRDTPVLKDNKEQNS